MMKTETMAADKQRYFSAFPTLNESYPECEPLIEPAWTNDQPKHMLSYTVEMGDYYEPYNYGTHSTPSHGYCTGYNGLRTGSGRAAERKPVTKQQRSNGKSAKPPPVPASRKFPSSSHHPPPSSKHGSNKPSHPTHTLSDLSPNCPPQPNGNRTSHHPKNSTPTSKGSSTSNIKTRPQHSPHVSRKFNEKQKGSPSRVNTKPRNHKKQTVHKNGSVYTDNARNPKPHKVANEKPSSASSKARSREAKPWKNIADFDDVDEAYADVIDSQSCTLATLVNHTQREKSRFVGILFEPSYEVLEKEPANLTSTADIIGRTEFADLDLSSLTLPATDQDRSVVGGTPLNVLETNKKHTEKHSEAAESESVNEDIGRNSLENEIDLENERKKLLGLSGDLLLFDGANDHDKHQSVWPTFQRSVDDAMCPDPMATARCLTDLILYPVKDWRAGEGDVPEPTESQLIPSIVIPEQTNEKKLPCSHSTWDYEVVVDMEMKGRRMTKATGNPIGFVLPESESVAFDWTSYENEPWCCYPDDPCEDHADDVKVVYMKASDWASFDVSHCDTEQSELQSSGNMTSSDIGASNDVTSSDIGASNNMNSSDIGVSNDMNSSDIGASNNVASSDVRSTSKKSTCLCSYCNRRGTEVAVYVCRKCGAVLNTPAILDAPGY